MMRQTNLSVLFSLLLAALFLSRSLAAQELSRDEFRRQWNQGMSLDDEKLCDKAMKRGAPHAITYFEELWFQARNGDNIEAEHQCDALLASWERCFQSRRTLEEVQRWADGATNPVYDELQSIRANSAKLWNDFTTNVAPNHHKPDYQACYEDYLKLAKMAESLGHYQEAADLWGLASVVGSKMPDKTIEEREQVVFAIEQQLACRDRWGYTFDAYYQRNKEYIKSEMAAIEADKKDRQKRRSEGYDPDAKGVESLVMPGKDATKHPLAFVALKDWRKGGDYGPCGGPVPLYWWLGSLGEAPASSKLGWFLQQPLYLLRRGANKFAISTEETDSDRATPIDVGPKGKPTTFHLDAGKRVPYAMFFWMGTDSEAIGTAKCNYTSTKQVASVYYKSATSWKATVGKEAIVYYDDDTSGTPGNATPWQSEYRSFLVGDATGSGVLAPLLDSMKVGRGKRVPFSAFVKLADGWFHQEVHGFSEVSLRPLNPEYFKTGKVKLAWSGPKATAPVQLVVQGKGVFSAAIFDIAGGKEVELPAGEYRVIWGRVQSGKGARLQTAQIYPTEQHEGFVVEPGKTKKLAMGAPFVLDFERGGDRNASIDALSICVRERSNCKLTAMQNIPLACSVMAAKDESGKGAKEYGEFVPFTNDQLVLAASKHYTNLGFHVACFPMPRGYKNGEMVLSFKLPRDGMKVGLTVKKHKFFKTLETVWK